MWAPRVARRVGLLRAPSTGGGVRAGLGLGARCSLRAVRAAQRITAPGTVREELTRDSTDEQLGNVF